MAASLVALGRTRAAKLQRPEQRLTARSTIHRTGIGVGREGD